MGRQIINTKASVSVDLDKNITTRLVSGPGVSDRVLLQKRSQKYIQAMTSLDHGTLTATQGIPELMEKIKSEFGELCITEYPLGIVSKCYLGQPYEVHILDLSGSYIVEHYKRGEPLPSILEKARTLAMNNYYAMVEVYPDKMVIVNPDGTTTKL